MIIKSAGHGEDPRYRDLLRGDFSAASVLRKVFAVQAAATWFISLPLQVSAALGPTPAPLRPVLIAGVVVWLVGALFEAVGDHQLRRFKADPANKGVIMDVGLWAWTGIPTTSVTRACGGDCGWPVSRRRFTGHGVLAGGDDLLPRVRHGGQTHREVHARSAWVRRIPLAHIVFRPDTTQIGD